MSNIEYSLNCDKCGEVFRSKDAFPAPQLCPKCSGYSLSNKELKEKCLLTDEEMEDQGFSIIRDGRGFLAIRKAQVSKALKIAEPLIRQDEAIKWIKALLKIGIMVSKPGQIPQIEKKIRRECDEEWKKWIEEDCNELRNSTTGDLEYYGVKPDELKARKKGIE